MKTLQLKIQNKYQSLLWSNFDNIKENNTIKFDDIIHFLWLNFDEVKELLYTKQMNDDLKTWDYFITDKLWRDIK